MRTILKALKVRKTIHALRGTTLGILRFPCLGGLSALVFAGTLLGATPAQGSAELAERDLSILLPTDDPALRLSLKDVGFSEDWYLDVVGAFQKTSVGPALDTENRSDEWQVVSVRIVPCQPLFERPHAAAGAFCWPEVRFVIQPIVRDIVNAGRTVAHFADDRAIHVLYDFTAEGQSFPLSLVQDLRQELAALGPQNPGSPGSPGAPVSLPSSEAWQSFVRARDLNVRALLALTAALREPTVPAKDFDRMGMRPEYALESVTLRRNFAERLKAFLAAVRHAQTGTASGSTGSVVLPKEVTAFSLPEGRDPAMIDEWVFLKFEAESPVALRRVAIPLLSARDGQPVGPALEAARVTMVRDDEDIYPAQSRAANGPYAREFAENMILFVPDIDANRQRIADGLQVRVPNTTCGSCHKLNKLRFDLHNLSYLQGEPMTVSPRVVRDVALDLRWLKSNDLLALP